MIEVREYLLVKLGSFDTNVMAKQQYKVLSLGQDANRKDQMIVLRMGQVKMLIEDIETY